jgi:hypothetical protein
MLPLASDDSVAHENKNPFVSVRDRKKGSKNSQNIKSQYTISLKRETALFELYTRRFVLSIRGSALSPALKSGSYEKRLNTTLDLFV